MVDSIRRDALARNLCARITRLADEGRDELDVIDGFVLRLELGLNNHGALDLRRDRRDWTHEADEEIADYAVYRALARTSRRFADVDRIELGLEEIADAAPLEIQRAAVKMGWDTTDIEGDR